MGTLRADSLTVALRKLLVKCDTVQCLEKAVGRLRPTTGRLGGENGWQHSRQAEAGVQPHPPVQRPSRPFQQEDRSLTPERVLSMASCPRPALEKTIRNSGPEPLDGPGIPGTQGGQLWQNDHGALNYTDLGSNPVSLHKLGG
jgi:hypothetical protein